MAQQCSTLNLRFRIFNNNKCISTFSIEVLILLKYTRDNLFVSVEGRAANALVCISSLYSPGLVVCGKSRLLHSSMRNCKNTEFRGRGHAVHHLNPKLTEP